MKKEIWKPIRGTAGVYHVSSHGRIKSLKFGKVRFLKPSSGSNDFLAVRIFLSGVYKTIKIHKLVAKLFKNHKDKGRKKLVIKHKDGNKHNNKASNLLLVSFREALTINRNKKTAHPPGVSTDGKGFKSAIVVKGKYKYLGFFKTEELASKAYKKAVRKELKK